MADEFEHTFTQDLCTIAYMVTSKLLHAWTVATSV